MFIIKIVLNGHGIHKKYKDAKAVHWLQKAKVVQLKLSRSSLKASSFKCLKKKMYFNFVAIYYTPIVQIVLKENSPLGFFEGHGNNFELQKKE